MKKKFIPIANVKLGEEEIAAAIEVMKSGYLIHGSKGKEFEEKFAQKVGSDFAVAVSSGTAALHVAYLALIEDGDEVLVPAFSHISTASMICYAKGKPIFCDLDPRIFTLDIKSAEKKITKKTVAIVPVHLFGNACDINEIVDFARDHNLKIIWDAAQAHGTQYKGKDVGSFGDIVTYSFYPTKNMFTGEGGIITTNNEELYNKMRLLRSHGQTEKYYHPYLGLNYRMTNVEAAIGLEQLKKLDSFIKKRRENAQFLDKHLEKINGILTPLVKKDIKHSYHQYTILLDTNKVGLSRNEFVAILKTKGVGTGIHYPRPLHKQPIFENMFGKEFLPISEDLAERVISLPVHPYLTREQLRRIIKAINDIIS